MKDLITRAMTKDGLVNAVAISSTGIVERARHVDSVARQYLETVKPMFERYIRNYVEYADLIVARGGKNARIVDILAGYVSDELSKRAYEA